jgi:hypothetical protein
MRAPASLLILAALAAALLTGCRSTGDVLAGARRANQAALAANPWPDDAAWIVAAAGTVTGAPDLEAALGVHPDARHRYLFRPGEQGDTRLAIAYHPGRGVIAGRGAAEALGVTFRRSARGETLVIRDVRRVEADRDATITLALAPVAGGKGYTVPVVIDPDFDGTLLLAPSVAATLGLHLYEIPGTADVHVALGRPFLGVRTRVHAAIPDLGVEADLEAVVPR